MNSAADYNAAIESDIDAKFTEFAVVIIKKDMKGPVKKLLDKMGIPSQFILSETFKRLGRKMNVYTNILR